MAKEITIKGYQCEQEITIKGYQCEKCGKAYVTEHLANECCREYFCSECGTQTRKYFSLCDECKEKRAYEKAVKMTYDEYLEKYPGHVLVFGDECYYGMEDVIDYCEDNEIAIPKYVWGTSRETVSLDAGVIEENALSDTYEDATFGDKGMAELEAFLKEWNKKYSVHYYVEAPIVVYVSE